MDRSIQLDNLNTPQGVQYLQDLLTELFRLSDSIKIVTTDPNGSLVGEKNQTLLYSTGGKLILKANSDGSTTWTTVTDS